MHYKREKNRNFWKTLKLEETYIVVIDLALTWDEPYKINISAMWDIAQTQLVLELECREFQTYPGWNFFLLSRLSYSFSAVTNDRHWWVRTSSFSGCLILS